jgi:ATP-dependent protease HslVU (ClpYQ) peptidase subunit
MITIDKLQLANKFSSREKADLVVKAITEDDKEWLYEVVQDKFQFLILVKDEENIVLGYL